jgi:hypothetical protein
LNLGRGGEAQGAEGYQGQIHERERERGREREREREREKRVSDGGKVAARGSLL